MTGQAWVRRGTDVSVETWDDPVRGHVGFRTLFGDGHAPTCSLTAGMADLGPGDWLGRHRHPPAEVYYIVAGTAVVYCDGQEHRVAAGSAVFIPPDVEHGIRNTGQDALRIFYVFPVDSLADVEYRFSARQH
jgi:quercetin dioxygenase-like cupin family protein